MSGKTIRLLQIVYGADLKRLMLFADDLSDLLEKAQESDVKKDAPKFRDAGVAAANAANQFAQYLGQRAADTESPLVKAQIAEDAKKFAQYVRVFLFLTNEIFLGT